MVAMNTEKGIETSKKPSFVFHWLFQKSGSKIIFDYLRNTGLCALLMFSAVFLKRSVLGSPIFEISNSSAYSELCEFALADYDDIVAGKVRGNAELYFEGFKAGGLRSFSVPSVSEHEEARVTVGTIVYRKDQRIDNDYFSHLVSLFIYIASFVLLLANIVYWIQSTRENMAPIRSGSMIKTALRFLDRSFSIFIIVGLTIPVFLAMYHGQNKLIGAPEQAIEQINDYVELLGDNEYVNVLNYYKDCDI